MAMTFHLTYDGEVFRPDEPINLEADTRIRVTIQAIESRSRHPRSFLATARTLNLDGPKDWAARIDDYLYGEQSRPSK